MHPILSLVLMQNPQELINSIAETKGMERSPLDIFSSLLAACIADNYEHDSINKGLFFALILGIISGTTTSMILVQLGLLV